MQLIELLFQAMSGGFLYKEMQRWREVEGLGALQIQHCADVAREYLGEMLESRCCIPMEPWGGDSLLLRILCTLRERLLSGRLNNCVNFT